MVYCTADKKASHDAYKLFLNHSEESVLLNVPYSATACATQGHKATVTKPRSQSSGHKDIISLAVDTAYNLPQSPATPFRGKWFFSSPHFSTWVQTPRLRLEHAQSTAAWQRAADPQCS